MSIALTLFSLEACATSKAAVPATETIEPPLPAAAAVQKVQWTDRPDQGGLLLPYGEYRKLESNVIEYRREIAELRDLVKYYRGKD